MNKKFVALAFLFFIASATTVSAYSPFKWQMCQSANVSGGLCDDYWESFKVMMGVPNETTNTASMNNYYNKTQMKSLYLNKTSVDTIYMRKPEALSIISNMTMDAIGKNNDTVKKTDLLQLRTDLGSEINKLRDDAGLSDYNNSDDNNDTMLILGGLALAGVLGYLYFNKKQNPNQNPMYADQMLVPVGKPAMKKIQSKKNLSLEKQVEDLQKKLTEEKKKAPEPKEELGDEELEDGNS